jgi:hypothetical protein
MTALNVSVFYGKTLNSAGLVVQNVAKDQNLLIPVLNNTYILVSPYSAPKTNIVNLTYYQVPNSFNFTYMQSLGYIPNAVVTPLKSDP